MHKTLYISKCCGICENTICSDINIFNSNAGKKNGLKLEGSEQLPFLKTGTTAAEFQILGKAP